MEFIEKKENFSVNRFDNIFNDLKNHFRDRNITRFAVTNSNDGEWTCEVGEVCGDTDLPSIFDFNQREYENNEEFNVALVIPTGIGASHGGHEGDAGPIVRVLAQACDQLITHPNTVNASDINKMSENTLYMEGSIISRFLMGTVGLQKVKNNRLLLAVDGGTDEYFFNAAVNSVNAAVATYGLNCTKVVKLNPSISMESLFSESGRAVGVVSNYESLQRVIEENWDQFDALAITSPVHISQEVQEKYAKSKGEMVNPWGGVEALLTHGTSHMYNIPSAHSPMRQNQNETFIDNDIVDPRLAAGPVSLSFLQCILMGLQRSPKIVTSPQLFDKKGILSASDISALVLPDRCIGLPTLAALKQGITVIAVEDHSNVLTNDLDILPWSKGQLIRVSGYLEAAGVLNALKAGVSINSTYRPLEVTPVEFSNSN